MIVIEEGVDLLRRARECFKRAGCPRTAARIRAAITSAGGARRHAATHRNR